MREILSPSQGYSKKMNQITSGPSEILIKTKVYPHIQEFLENAKAKKNKGNVTNEALEFYHYYKTQRKLFFVDLAETHYKELKMIVRNVGREINKKTNFPY